MNAISTIPELNAFLDAKSKRLAERQKAELAASQLWLVEQARLAGIADQQDDEYPDAACLCIAALRAAHAHITATSGDVTVLGQIERALSSSGEAA